MTADVITAVATYMVNKKATVRQAAKEFKVSKSTVHKNMTQDLKYLNSVLYNNVQEILKTNKAERHIRGGAATREKYRKLRIKRN